MKQTRILVTRYGGPEELRVVEEDCPEPGEGEARVRVLAAGVSLPDLMMREGIHPETPELPFTPGWDLVGVVHRLGAGVSGLHEGQIVAALPIRGAYAEYVCLPQAELVPVPPGLDAAQAVSLVLNYITAYQMLHRTARVRAGQRVLIHGASGGVGSALLELGRLAGWKCTEPARREGHRPFQTWAASRLTTRTRTSWRRSTAGRARGWSSSSIASGEPTSGAPAGRCAPAGRWWPMA